MPTPAMTLMSVLTDPLQLALTQSFQQPESVDYHLDEIVTRAAFQGFDEENKEITHTQHLCNRKEAFRKRDQLKNGLQA